MRPIKTASVFWGLISFGLFFLIISPVQAKILPVPYTPQAPQGVWREPWKNACEETSIVMVKNFYESRTLDKKRATSEITNIFSIKNKIYGKSLDEGAQKVVNLINNFLFFSARVVENPTLEQIKEQIDLEQPVIIPVAVKILKNKYFVTANGYHMLVLSGYDDASQEFISQEPGTRFGKDYRYPYETILAALHDYSTKKIISEGRQVAIFTAPGWSENEGLDGDGDGLNKVQELEYKTLAWSSDTDGDGFKDGWEVQNSYSPIVAERKLARGSLIKEQSDDAIFELKSGGKRLVGKKELVGKYKKSKIVTVSAKFLDKLAVVK